MLRLAASGIHSFTNNDPIIHDIISQQKDLGVIKRDFFRTAIEKFDIGFCIRSNRDILSVILIQILDYHKHARILLMKKNIELLKDDLFVILMYKMVEYGSNNGIFTYQLYDYENLTDDELKYYGFKIRDTMKTKNGDYSKVIFLKTTQCENVDRIGMPIREYSDSESESGSESESVTKYEDNDR